MDLNTLCSRLRLAPEKLDSLRPYWEDSPETEELPRFLTVGFFAEYREKLNLSPDELARMDALVKKVCDCAAENPALCAFFNRVRRLLFVDKNDFPSGIRYEVYSFYDGDKNVFDKIGDLIADSFQSANIDELTNESSVHSDMAIEEE